MFCKTWVLCRPICKTIPNFPVSKKEKNCNQNQRKLLRMISRWSTVCLKQNVVMWPPPHFIYFTNFIFVVFSAALVEVVARGCSEDRQEVHVYLKYMLSLYSCKKVLALYNAIVNTLNMIFCQTWEEVMKELLRNLPHMVNWSSSWIEELIISTTLLLGEFSPRV